jgi:hypothetical protein
MINFAIERRNSVKDNVKKAQIPEAEATYPY